MEYKILEEMFRDESPKSVFEMGVGGGGLLKDVSDHFGGIRVGGIDISRVRMEDLKTRFPGQEFFVHDLNDPWPVDSDSFDVVFSVGVLMYIFDPLSVMREMFRVGKKVIIAEYHHGELDKFGTLTKPFLDGTKMHHGIVRNYLDVLSELKIPMEVRVSQITAGKTIIKCQKT